MKRSELPKIAPPRYRVGRCVLNEYELRCLMAQVAQGHRPPLSVTVYGPNGTSSKMRQDGRFYDHLDGFDIMGNFTLDMIRSDRETGRTAAKAAKFGRKP